MAYSTTKPLQSTSVMWFIVHRLAVNIVHAVSRCGKRTFLLFYSKANR